MWGGKRAARINELELENAYLRTQLAATSALLAMKQVEWNKLVRRINALGGEEFLNRGQARVENSTFGKDDIRRLLQLCHPDKHGGSELAQRMTAKLLEAKG